MPGLRFGIFVTVAYTAMIAAVTFYVVQVADAPSGMSGILFALFPIQLVAVLFCVAVVIRYFGWRNVGFGRLDWSGMVWLVPSWIVLAAIWWNLFGVLTFEDLRDFGGTVLVLLVLTPFLVAFGEEVLFRGILLRGAMTRLNVPQAMMVSAISFGAFHFVNGLGDQSIAATSQQILFAGLVGFFLAPIALRIGNLWPLIIWHWLWNVAVLLSQDAGAMHPLVLIGMAIQAVISVWLWVDLIRQARAS